MLIKDKKNLKSTSPKNHKGQGMTEYMIIVALIAVAAIGVFRLFGDTLRTQMGGLAMELSGQSGAGATATATGLAGQAAAAGAAQKNLSNFSNTNQ